MLKYQGQFKKGDTIRSYGFDPESIGGKEVYVQGTVIEEDYMTDHGFMAVKIKITEDMEMGGLAVGHELPVALEVMLEFDNRVIKIAEDEPKVEVPRATTPRVGTVSVAR